jgi:hypothetical protein
MSRGLKLKATVHFDAGERGRKYLRVGAAEPARELPTGSIPRVTRPLALTHRFDGLLRDGVVKDQAELARLAGTSRTRVTQILNLLLLAPEVQEEILFLSRTTSGRDAVTERDLRALVAEPTWERQRGLRGES